MDSWETIEIKKTSLTEELKKVQNAKEISELSLNI